MKIQAQKLPARLLTVCLAALALSVPALASERSLVQDFEQQEAGASGTAAFPKGWNANLYGDGDKGEVEVRIAARNPAGQALHLEGTFRGESYRGLLLTSPAVSSVASAGGIPTGFSFDLRCQYGKPLTVEILSQDSDYQTTGKAVLKVTPVAGQWVSIEADFADATLSGNFSASDPHHVFMLHLNQRHGYIVGSPFEFSVDNVMIIRSER